MYPKLLTNACARLLFRRELSSKSQPSKHVDVVKRKKSFGQPTADTHPYLLNKGEVTPGILQREFQDRRQRLVESIREFTKGRNKDIDRHLIVIPSATKQYMSEKIPYVFRQNSDFLYLSGCLEPDSCLVLTTADAVSQHNASLFVRQKDAHSEIWDGPRTGPEQSVDLFGVNQALSTTEFENFIGCFLKTKKSTYLWYDIVGKIQPDVHKVMTKSFNNMGENFWESPKELIHKLRVIKSPAEANLMRQSCQIASKAIAATISATKPGINEHELFATVDYQCRMNGAEYLAYPPVVASGERATIIHYINNNQVVRDKEMVLMDAGCEYHSYTSDITRTWPGNGKFSEEQRIIYECVLDVQLKLIEICNRFPTLDKLFDYMCLYLGQNLREIGIIPSSVSDKELPRIAYEFCPHHVSHYLGMDVHDTPTVPRNIKTTAGMVLTIEPGLYFPMTAKVPEKFKGLGIRIEDDILMTASGPEVLSNCPKFPNDIEALICKTHL